MKSIFEGGLRRVLKYCPKCGAELFPDAMFCMECGLSIAEHMEKLKKSKLETKNAKLENIATGEVKFSLMGVEHVFGKEFVEYNAVRKIFVVNAYNKRKEFSSEYDRRVHNFDELYSVGMKLFADKLRETLDMAVGVIKRTRNVNISTEKFYTICQNDGSVSANKYLQPFMDVYAEVQKVAEQLASYRQLERDSRSKWYGGGEGITGAISGAIKAGLLNMATDAVRSIGDSLTDSSDRKKLDELKDKVFRDKSFANGKNMSAYLKDCMEAICQDVFSGVVPIIGLHHVLDRDAIKNTESLISKAQNYRPVTPLEIINAIYQNPFEPLLYYMLYMLNDATYPELLSISEYVGTKDIFLDQLAVWYSTEVEKLAPKKDDELSDVLQKQEQLQLLHPELDEARFRALKKSVMDQLDKMKGKLEVFDHIIAMSGRFFSYKKTIERNFDERGVEVLWEQVERSSLSYACYLLMKYYRQHIDVRRLRAKADEGFKIARYILLVNLYTDDKVNATVKINCVYSIKKMADEGCIFAMARAGLWYCDPADCILEPNRKLVSQVFTKDEPEKGLRYINTAIEHCYPPAMKILSEIYDFGIKNVERNGELAYAWQKFASRFDDYNAMEMY